MDESGALDGGETKTHVLVEKLKQPGNFNLTSPEAAKYAFPNETTSEMENPASGSLVANQPVRTCQCKGRDTRTRTTPDT
ncbi:hypothetical protein J6590_085576 [Homalodisca vitripennis]|nr:hypothetical protein J6590_085576 [Homalodisca vitripennis]